MVMQKADKGMVAGKIRNPNKKACPKSTAQLSWRKKLSTAKLSPCPAQDDLSISHPPVFSSGG
jgi:hypothetical protein